MKFQTIDQVIDYFAQHMSGAYSRVNFDAFLLAQKFQYKIPSIHITGTNGKGSTATLIQNIYQYSGRRVGLFTSPAFDRFSEMIYIDDDEIDDRYVISFMNKFCEQFEKFNLTTFEMQTFLAVSYFSDSNVQLSVIEVGMGGLLDATNIFTPVLSVITNIGLEHTNYLGPTIVDVANHKAGIIKPRVPVLIGKVEPQALRVIEQVAKNNEAPLFKVGEVLNVKSGINQYFSYGHYENLELTMNGSYQIINAALAIEATEILKKRWPIKEKDLRTGLYKTFMPGRLEVLSSDPTIVIDGAHNPHGVQALVRSLSSFENKIVFVIFASFKDKDVTPMFKQLEAVSKHIVVTSFSHPRARHLIDYPVMNYIYIDDFKEALMRTYKNAPKRSVILLTGSLAFAGAVRAFIQAGGLRR
jgi:dihydrofolate synthase/folylpolyglutamate synthase